MNIRNYTSSVSADKSLMMIEKKLVQHGATNIMKSYEGGAIESVSFRIKYGDNNLSFQLPARVHEVFKLFVKQAGGRITEAKRRDLMAQATRTAWKNMYEWVDLQMTLVECEQMNIVEAFMSQMLVAQNTTAFQKLQQSEFKALN